MKRQTILLLIVTLCSHLAAAQQVQWANKVLAYSSQRDAPFYGAQQVLGVPNALEGYTDCPFSWATATPDDGKAFIHVAFAEAMTVQQIAIVESVNPGAIDEIFLYDAAGNEYLVFQTVRSRPIYAQSRFFIQKIEKTAYQAVSLKLTLNTNTVKGFNQIDAIAISDGEERIRLKVEEIKYSAVVPYPEDLGENVNSEADERLPIISPDGRTLYFTRKQHPDNIGKERNDDIWVSHLQTDGTWGVAQNIGAPLNNEKHNFVAAVGQGGQLLYLQNAYTRRAKEGIAYATLNGGTWSEPAAMKVEDMYNLSDFVHYHVSPDGNILLMAMQRDDAVGDLDLYVSFRKDNENWTTPQGLGSQINTLSTESSVFLAADYKTIYFASAGHYGYGGLDIFMARRLDDTWTNWTSPKNLGAYLNTPGNDYNYSVPASGQYAYFSSDFRGKGQSDLYRIELPKEAQPEAVTLITGRLIHAQTQDFIREEVQQLVIPRDKMPKIEGFVYVPIDADAEEELDGDTPTPTPKRTATPQFEELATDILVVPLEKNAVLTLQNILFDANKATFKPSSATELRRLTDFLKQYPTLLIEIGGHTNSLCDDTFAEALSLARATAIADFLIENGIPATQLVTKGYGKSRPLTKDDTPEARRKNQRVEVRILEGI